MMYIIGVVIEVTNNNKKRMVKMKVVADTINGVFQVESFDGSEIILSAKDFYESLSTLADGEVIGCEDLAEYQDKIDAEYGIH